MTGFSQVEGSNESFDYVWEAKSINGRTFDLRCKLCNGMELFEPIIRRAAARRFSRGSVSVILKLKSHQGNSRLEINRELLNDLIAITQDYVKKSGVKPPRLDGMLALPGVLERKSEVEFSIEESAKFNVLESDLNRVLDDLKVARAYEGERLKKVLANQLASMESLIDQARTSADLRSNRIKERINEHVNTLLDCDGVSIPEERLAQELALVFVKIDIREELDRVEGHIAGVGKLLEQGGLIGRKLDFMAQELNREANTMCAKSNDHKLCEIGIELKTVIDQFREQFQNI